MVKPVCLIEDETPQPKKSDIISPQFHTRSQHESGHYYQPCRFGPFGRPGRSGSAKLAIRSAIGSGGNSAWNIKLKWTSTTSAAVNRGSSKATWMSSSTRGEVREPWIRDCFQMVFKFRYFIRSSRSPLWQQSRFPKWGCPNSWMVYGKLRAAAPAATPEKRTSLTKLRWQCVYIYTHRQIEDRYRYDNDMLLYRYRYFTRHIYIYAYII